MYSDASGVGAGGGLAGIALAMTGESLPVIASGIALASTAIGLGILLLLRTRRIRSLNASTASGTAPE